MIYEEGILAELKKIAREFEKEKGVKIVTTHLPVGHAFFDPESWFIKINWDLVEEEIYDLGLTEEKEIIEWFKHVLEHEYLHYLFQQQLPVWFEVYPLEYHIATEMFAYRNDGMPDYIREKQKEEVKEDLWHLITFKIVDIEDIRKLVNHITFIATKFTREEIEELIDELNIENTKLARVLRQLHKIKDEFTTPEKAVKLAKVIRKILE